MLIHASTLQHLRFPFSFLLAPAFLMTVATHLQLAPRTGDIQTTSLAFLILHGLVYPASNGFNSWCDQDEGPIGGVITPLPVTNQLRILALAMDFAALILAAVLMNPHWAAGLLAYIVASRAYSHPSVRLKARPWLGWTVVAFFQGAWIMGLTWFALNPTASPGEFPWICVLGTSLLLGGSYPLTQIYQHAEDQKRGDLTLSRHLGVRGTLVFSALASGAGILGLGIGWFLLGIPELLLALLIALLPASKLLRVFAKSCLEDPAAAHRNPEAALAIARITQVSAWSLNIVWLAVLFKSLIF
jgi:1,4-dihydroxy-2-naphthoate octaprenyltransferase